MNRETGKRMSIVIGMLLTSVLAGCAVNPNTGNVGMDKRVVNKNSVVSLGSGLLGAALCNQVFKGHGSKEGWTAACGIGGYFIGKAFLQRSNAILENNRSGQTTTWKDPDGRQVSMTPKRTYYSGDQPCRAYETRIMVDGRPETATGTACRRNDGTWRING